ncbi:ABC transporter ATP-binding protein [Lentibacillus sp. CBA3610]|uniref:ABC transporter ATP-binding protein n=1 Tax=Lentibacillus sp. CBA3610 TaxID=2518176 RepID=UPI001C3F0DEC|nr:ABC transporter ATP-binding protein [Lentibacillus sp. CBA3610]
MTILKVDNLSKKFGGLNAVKNVSFSVGKGEILGLIGPNGAGKTTCFNMIAGVFSQSEGKIIFEGKEINGNPPYVLNNRGLARTFQIVKPLAKLSVFDNLMVACLSKSKNIKDARKKAKEVITKTNLEELKNTTAGSLSIGNLKRLEVARALATDPTLLLMDEPMGGLTPSEVDGSIQLIKDINKEGVTIVLVEHIMKAVMAVSDSIIVLQNGSLISKGEPNDVVNDKNVIKAYLGDEYVKS